MSLGFRCLMFACALAIAGCQSVPETTGFESSCERPPRDLGVEVLVDDRIESLALAERIRHATLEALSRCGFETSDPEPSVVVVVTVGQLPDATPAARAPLRPPSISRPRNEGMTQAWVHSHQHSATDPHPDAARIGLLWSAVERRHLDDATRPPGEWPRMWRAFASLRSGDGKWSTAGPALVDSLRQRLSESWQP